MRKTLVIIICFILGIIYASSQSLPSSGVWNATTFEGGGTVTINLTGDVYLRGIIKVKNATTLRIINNTGKNITIHNDVDGTRGSMFRVYEGAKLVFNKANDSDNGLKHDRIIVDGGANFYRAGLDNLTAQTNKRFNRSMIESVGALELENVTLQNCYCADKASSDQAGALGIVPPMPDDGIGVGGRTSNITCRYTHIKDCTIEKCKSRFGSVLFLGNSNYLAATQSPEDCKIEFINCTIRNCAVFGDSNGWGGMIRCRGGSANSMYLINTIFTDNFSHNDGATLWWNAAGRSTTKCVIDGCEFSYNTAKRDAGGLRLEGTFEFTNTLTGKNTVIHHNKCEGLTRTVTDGVSTYANDGLHMGNGGGIHIYGYAGGEDIVGGTLTYYLPSCLEVRDNEAAGYGGGIAFEFNSNLMKVNTKIYADLDGVVINNNKSGLNGGGVYMSNTTDPARNYSFYVELNSGSIENNQSPNGGGMYVNNIDITSDANNKTLYIKGNSATEDGGGIYLIKGDLSLQRTEIKSNSAKNGGGLFINEGSFSSTSGSIISNNQCEGYGGGVLINNDTPNRHTVTLNAGTIGYNTAMYGGGITAYGALDLYLINTNIEQNSALNGGGLVVMGKSAYLKAVVNYQSGLIRYNNARATSTITTAYNSANSAISGIGGGIYIGEYTNMYFNNPSQFGIYSNKAQNGADDLFCTNNNTYIELPNVQSLKLTEFKESLIHDLYWGEDYVTNDIHYDKGLKLKGDAWDSDKTNQRYRDVHEHKVEGKYYVIDFNDNTILSYTNKYLCLTIGWYVSYINLIKEGMKKGDNAIFKIYKDGAEYMTVMLTDTDTQEDNKRHKQIALKSNGTYKIVETDWSWAYGNSNKEITRVISTGSSEAERTFLFTNTYDENAPIHDESLKINIMNISN